MARGFITFYSMPDAVPSVIRLATMVAMQTTFRRLIKTEGAHGHDDSQRDPTQPTKEFTCTPETPAGTYSYTASRA
jgi:hypothetical protein